MVRRTTSQSDFLVDLAGDFAHDRLADEAAEAFAFLRPSDAARHGEVLVWLGEHLPTLLHRNDAMGMAVGLEARFPYLEEEVLRFGVTLPVSAKIAIRRHIGDRRHPFTCVTRSSISSTSPVSAAARS